MEKIAIIGAGLIGRAWAMVFARSGHMVKVWDVDPAAVSNALTLIDAALRELSSFGLITEDPKTVRARITAVATLAEALKDADYVQENTAERVDVKRKVYADMDAAAKPECILASSTSTIPTSVFSAGLNGRHRCIVAHPVNPPHLVPVVELCGAPWTSAETKERARAVMLAAGQVPIDVKREIDGFVLNRLQAALLTEAFRLVQEGVVSPQDLDHTIADGLGLRWAFMGPFETIELNAPGGTADYCERYVHWFRRYVASAAGPRVWDDENWRRVADAWGPAPQAEAVARKSGWRNDRLAALVAHKRGRKPWQD
jgi:L-gulonate 3-dehydrogenase